VESLFGDFEESLIHLKEGLLCTKDPEELRRGIFRYCYELAKGKYPKSEKDREELDNIFANAFFAEKDMHFEEVLSKFLLKHTSNASACLTELYNVISRSCNAKEEKEKYFDVIEKFQQLYKDDL